LNQSLSTSNRPRQKIGRFDGRDAMSKSAAQVLVQPNRASEWVKQGAVVVGASLFVALCARVTVPLPFTPVPLTLQNFGVLVVALLLGSKRGFAALALYLAEGAAGLPVFNPAGLGAVAQLFGATGGFLMAYPFVALVAGWIYERSSRRFGWAALAGLAGEIVLFAGGLGWLFVLTHSISQAIRWGLYWFVFAEVIKIMLAAGVARGWRKRRERI
jgi:biotin transport system substrate-specific component